MTNIYFETYGCSANFADSEQMAGLLKQAKFNIVNNIDEAYIIVLNSCTVKNPTESAFFKRLKEITIIKKKAEEKLISRIIKFEKKRQCWN